MGGGGWWACNILGILRRLVDKLVFWIYFISVLYFGNLMGIYIIWEDWRVVYSIWWNNWLITCYVFLIFKKAGYWARLVDVGFTKCVVYLAIPSELSAEQDSARLRERDLILQNKFYSISCFQKRKLWLGHDFVGKWWWCIVEKIYIETDGRMITLLNCNAIWCDSIRKLGCTVPAKKMVSWKHISKKSCISKYFFCWGAVLITYRIVENKVLSQCTPKTCADC